MTNVTEAACWTRVRRAASFASTSGGILAISNIDVPVLGREPGFSACFRIASFAFAIETDVVEASDLLSRVLAVYRIPRAIRLPTYRLELEEGPNPYVVYLDGKEISRSSSPIGNVDYVCWHSNQQGLEGEEDHLVVHASAASWKGQGFVFPAAMDSGKTTLVAGLTRGGWDYLTDEAALINPADGWLEPFPKTLWMEPGSIRLFPDLIRRLPESHRELKRLRSYVSADDLRPGSIGERCGISHVVTPRYSRGAETRLEPISRAEGAIVLANNCFNFQRLGLKAFNLITEVASRARCYRLHVGDLDEAVRLLTDLAASASAKD